MLALVALLLCAPPAGQLLDLRKGTLTYTVVHRLHEVRATSQQVEGRALAQPDGTVKVQVRVRVATFDSGNSNRDEHMREATHEQSHPYAEVKGTMSGVTVPLQQPLETTLHGTVELNGDKQAQEVAVKLQLHQVGGLLTLASLGATVIFGQLNYNDLYGGGGSTRRWYDWHRYSALTSAALFAGTGALALFAPSPLEKRLRLDTAMLHRIAMGVATAGLATQIVLGFVTAGKGGSLSQRDFALAHQIVGYSTFGATAVGFGG